MGRWDPRYRQVESGFAHAHARVSLGGWAGALFALLEALRAQGIEEFMDAPFFADQFTQTGFGLAFLGRGGGWGLIHASSPWSIA
jgi:hypothetical protein